MANFDYTATCPQEKDGKTYWCNIGVAFKSKDKDSYTIQLNALPIGDKIVLVRPKEEK